MLFSIRGSLKPFAFVSAPLRFQRCRSDIPQTASITTFRSTKRRRHARNSFIRREPSDSAVDEFIRSLTQSKGNPLESWICFTRLLLRLIPDTTLLVEIDGVNGRGKEDGERVNGPAGKAIGRCVLFRRSRE